jgi:adenylosuccinate lyase
LKNDPEVGGRLSSDELEALFNLDYHFKEVDTIFGRVFGAA